MTFEPCGARLAGGLFRPVDTTTLHAAVQAVLPDTALGKLDGSKNWPGFARAAADTLRKAWRAGIGLPARSANPRRLASIARLKAAVVATLPPAALRPRERAIRRPRYLRPAPCRAAGGFRQVRSQPAAQPGHHRQRHSISLNLRPNPQPRTGLLVAAGSKGARDFHTGTVDPAAGIRDLAATKQAADFLVVRAVEASRDPAAGRMPTDC